MIKPIIKAGAAEYNHSEKTIIDNICEVYMTYPIIPDDDALGKCAWCRSRIYEDTEVFALGARLQPGVDLSEYQSHCIEIALVSTDRTLNMMVTVEGSEAKNDNKDAMFMVCSEACGSELKKALEEEISLGKLFGGVES